MVHNGIFNEGIPNIRQILFHYVTMNEYRANE